MERLQHKKRTQMKRKVFISYSHQDSITAKGISRFLARQGFDVWIDVDNLVYGKEWAGNIDEAIAAADVFLAVISRNSVRRPEVLREVAEALLLEKAKPDYQVLFIVMGSVHTSWFSDEDRDIAAEIIQHLNDVQFIRLNARGSITIGKMQDLIGAMEGKLIYTNESEVPSDGNYIYESGMPEEARMTARLGTLITGSTPAIWLLRLSSRLPWTTSGCRTPSWSRGRL